jgi:hypothetical protein
MQLGIGELTRQRESRARIADDAEHDMWIPMWIPVGVDWTSFGRHA